MRMMGEGEMAYGGDYYNYDNWSIIPPDYGADLYQVRQPQIEEDYKSYNSYA